MSNTTQTTQTTTHNWECIHNEGDPRCCIHLPGEEVYRGILGGEIYCRSYLLENDMLEVLMTSKNSADLIWITRWEYERFHSHLGIRRVALDLF